MKKLFGFIWKVFKVLIFILGLLTFVILIAPSSNTTSTSSSSKAVSSSPKPTGVASTASGTTTSSKSGQTADAATSQSVKSSTSSTAKSGSASSDNTDSYVMRVFLLNLLGFLVYAIYRRFNKAHSYNIANRLYVIVVTLCVIGGAIGVAIASFLYGPKIGKNEEDGIAPKLFIIGTAILYVLIHLVLIGGISSGMKYDFGEYFATHSPVVGYLLLMNALSFIFFVFDKISSIKRWNNRVSISMLLIISFLGGAAGGILAMVLFKHKIRKTYFIYPLPIMLATHMYVLLAMMNM